MIYNYLAVYFFIKPILIKFIYIYFQELYSEYHPEVCVMFASIPNFKDFYQQSAANKNGIECIRVLNEIITEFDQV